MAEKLDRHNEYWRVRNGIFAGETVESTFSLGDDIRVHTGADVIVTYTGGLFVYRLATSEESARWLPQS